MVFCVCLCGNRASYSKSESFLRKEEKGEGERGKHEKPLMVIVIPPKEKERKKKGRDNR